MSWFARRRDAARRRRARAAPVRHEPAEPVVAPPPVVRSIAVGDGEGDDGHRLLLLSSGPGDGWGVADQRDGLAGALAEALHLATGQRVVVDVLVDDHWEERDPIAALRAHTALGHDAVVVAGVYYRPAVLEATPDAWRRTTEELRDILLAEVGVDGVLLLLRLPWHDAIARDPDRWGGDVGERIVALTRIAVDTFEGFGQIGALQLHPPADPAEWRAPGFSVATYRSWGVEAALALLPRLRNAERAAATAGDRPGHPPRG